jgi:hypothetical protein
MCSKGFITKSQSRVYDTIYNKTNDIPIDLELAVVSTIKFKNEIDYQDIITKCKLEQEYKKEFINYQEWVQTDTLNWLLSIFSKGNEIFITPDIENVEASCITIASQIEAYNDNFGCAYSFYGTVNGANNHPIKFIGARRGCIFSRWYISDRSHCFVKKNCFASVDLCRSMNHNQLLKLPRWKTNLVIINLRYDHSPIYKSIKIDPKTCYQEYCLEFFPNNYCQVMCQHMYNESAIEFPYVALFFREKRIYTFNLCMRASHYARHKLAEDFIWKYISTFM